MAIAVLFTLGAPFVLSEYGLSLLTEMLIFGVYAMSLNLLIGYTGLISLGHAAFFGAGGYCVGLLARHLGVTSLANLPIALLAAALIAAVFAPFVLRVSGAYFLMLTLALSQVLYGMAWLWRGITGGDDGLTGIPRPELPVLGSGLGDSVPFYYFTLVCAALAAVTMLWTVNSPFGLALRGIRDNESRLGSLGYDTWLHKYTVYVLSAAYAALAGALYTYLYGYISPHHLSWGLSGEGMVMVILGGAETFWGPAFGAVLVLLLKYVVSSFTDRWTAILGLTLVAVVLVAPRGLADPIQVLNWVRSVTLKRLWCGAPARYVPGWYRQGMDR